MRKSVAFIGFLLVIASTAFGQDLKGGGIRNDDAIGGGGAKGGLKGGKLLDDSTKNIYGPTTTKYTFESNIKYNQLEYYVIDTLIDDMHRFNYVNAQKNQLQDLGNIGTAAVPMFYQLPKTIGVNSGINIYDLYFKTADQIKYYDTHSPFSNMDIVIGGNGRAITNVNYSRNINPQWNFGFDYKGLYIDKQIERTGKGDRNVLSNAYDLYTHYQTPDRKYQFLAHLSRNMHKVNEFGGVLVEDKDSLILYFEENTQKVLQEASTQELRTNIHFYQQYQFSSLIQAYHQIDRYKQENTFRDDISIDDTYHNAIYFDSTTTFDRIDFHSTTSEQGVKGDVGRVFYNFYHKSRFYDIDYKYVKEDSIDLETSGNEQYGGAKVRLRIDSLTTLSGDLEYLVGSNYQIGGLFQSSNYAFGFRRMQYAPSFMERYYYGNHDQWENDFESTSVDEFKASIDLSFGRTTLKPFGRWVLFNDYIYYDSTGVPQQVSDFQLLNIGTEMHTNFKDKIHFTAYGVYSSVQGNNRDVMRVPELLLNAKIYYQNIVFDGNLQFQFGVDLHWKNTYLANAYDPTIQQYHLQDNFPLPSTAVIDIFANLKVNRGRLFLKYINLGKAFSDIGYFASPGYIGQINGMDFGFKWAFYD